MTPESWRRMEEIYLDALNRPSSEREAFVRHAASGDAELERKILDMLAAEELAGSFLEKPAVEVAAAAEEAPAQTPVADPSGRTFAHYRILEKLGSGGMGVVYKAEDLRLKRLVAIKLLPESVAHDPAAVGRFEREARAASALNHPNICTIYGVEEFEGRPVIAMELLEGESLRDRIRRGPLQTGEILPLAIEICEALAAAHARGIIHRDIKPGNLFVTSLGHAKVLDFGLAKFGAMAAEPGSESAPTMTMEDTLTTSGSTLGTASYMSPEQVRGQPLDGRSDIFSLGVALYEMATGQLPFRGRSMGAVFDAILNKQPIAPSAVMKGMDPGLDDVILSCLEKDREARRRNTSEIAADLRQIQNGLRPKGAAHPMAGRGRKRLGAAGVAAGVAALAAGYFLLHTPPKLPAPASIVLSDFVNKTGDKAFDGALRKALAAQLERSPSLTLVSDSRMRELLQMMEQPAGARPTPEAAREICIRNGSAAVVDGELTQTGGQFAIGLTARSCGADGLLHREQADTGSASGVLPALTAVAARFSRGTVEAIAAKKERNVALADATTPSLEALKVYSAALALNSAKQSGAQTLYRHAIDLDPSFAMAYAQLGNSYGEMGQSDLSGKYVTKAHDLRAGVSDRERFFIESTYDFRVTGNLEQAQQTLEAWTQMYPDDRGAWEGMGLTYVCQGDFARAIEADSRALQMQPNVGISYMILADEYLAAEQPAEAAKVLTRAADHNLGDFPFLRRSRFDQAFYRDQRDEMKRLVDASHGSANAEDTISDVWSFALAYWGRLDEARGWSRHAVSLAVQESEPETAALYEDAAAIREALFGFGAAARTRAAAALALSHDREAEYGAALAYSLTKDAAHAAPLTKDLEIRFGEDTSVRFNYLPVLHALAALNRNAVNEALEMLRDASPYEISDTRAHIHGFFGACYPVFLRGMVYLAANRGADAATEFRKILAHRGLILEDPAGALAHLELGRALRMSHDIENARKEYGAFLELWKDADREIPILIEAKREAEQLK